ncbi:Rhodanese-like domain-containing protein 8, chloroplastic [Coccomyxa sp. Obi]|nr:Rhodanese-like domain-containing protein 8, chloroplastic [Coccomyxa sp. Obi]
MGTRIAAEEKLKHGFARKFPGTLPRQNLSAKLRNPDSASQRPLAFEVVKNYIELLSTVPAVTSTFIARLRPEISSLASKSCSLALARYSSQLKMLGATTRGPAAMLDIMNAKCPRCMLPTIQRLSLRDAGQFSRSQGCSQGARWLHGAAHLRAPQRQRQPACSPTAARAGFESWMADDEESHSASSAHACISQSSQFQEAAGSVAESRSRGPPATSSGQAIDYCVVNFYHLTDVNHPFQTLRAHQKWMLGRDIQGRIYISAQGINAQYSGRREDALAYAHWVSQQRGFEGLKWMAEDCKGHLFPKLRLKIRPNLVQLAGGTRDLPITDPEARATPLSPSQWQEMLRTAVVPATLRQGGPATAGSDVGSGGTPGGPDAGGNAQGVMVLDVRNAYEWDAGHFVGAQRPLEDHFNETPTDASGDAELPAYLQGASPDTPVLMYCTGGIRCDIYSTYLRRKGFKNLYTLEKGIQNYLKEKGDDMWNGSLFVFDARMAVRPGQMDGAARQLPAAAPCQMCGGAAELPHANCANIDCNKLFLACPACKKKHSGCCCEGCTRGQRLIRRANGGGNYARWLDAATEGLTDDDEVSEAKRQEALRRQQAVLARRIAAGRGDGRARRRLARKERMAQRTAAERAAHDERRRLRQEALQAQREREAAEEAAAERSADLATRLAELRARREQQQPQLAEAA